MPNNIELRDYFAGCVLQGLLANPELQKRQLKDLDKIEKEHDEFNRSEYNQYQHCLAAYKFADAMMNYREEKNAK